MPSPSQKIFKACVINDLQCPYEDKDAVDVMVQIAAEFQPEVLAINGDMFDLMNLSRYPNVRTKLNEKVLIEFESELDRGVELAKRIVAQIKPKRILWTNGNHEFRFMRAISNADPQTKKILELKILRDAYDYSKLFRFEELGVPVKFAGEYPAGLWLHPDLPAGENVWLEHGYVARKKSGYTCTALMEDRMSSVICGHCVGIGTLITLRRGMVPIEQVVVGDEALTRSGWKRVKAAGQTGTKQTTDFYGVPLTLDHRVFCNGRFSKVSDIIELCSKSIHLFIHKSSFSMAQPFVDIQTRSAEVNVSTTPVGSKDERSAYTWPSGRALTGLFLKAVKSIIKMKKRRTTISVTLKRFLSELTAGITSKVFPLMVSTSIEGICISVPTHKGVPFVAQTSCLVIEERGFATRIVTKPITQLGEPIPVFDLEVEDVHEFFANGVLIHNCEKLSLLWRHVNGDRNLFGIENGNLSMIGVPGLGEGLYSGVPHSVPDYMNHTQGFSLITRVDGHWFPQLIRIIEGRAWWNNKFYRSRVKKAKG
jgi:hypothetical protein